MKHTRFFQLAGGVTAFLGGLLIAGTAFATTPTFTSSNLTIGAGHSTSITSQNNISLYLGSNPGSNVVSVAINGTQVTFTGLMPGSSAVNVCAVGTASDCTTVNVTVQTGSVTGISFSQNNFSLTIGNNQPVTISGGNGTYSISSNSNTSAVSTNLSGTSLTVTGLAAGGSTIHVCDSANTCSDLVVTVSSSGTTTSTSTLTFSSNNFSLQAGGSQVVTISGGNGAYSITNNTSLAVLSGGMTQNGVTVYASGPGTATLTVCDSANKCGTITATVTASPSTSNQAVTFSNASPTINVGQTLVETLSGNAVSYVVLNNTNPDVAQATMSSNTTLTLVGSKAGSDSVTVCATGGNCSQLSVTVAGAAATPVVTPTPTLVVTTPTPVVTTPSVPTIITTNSGVNTSLLLKIKNLQAAVLQAMSQLQSIQSQLNDIVSQVASGAGSTGSGVATIAPAVSGSFTELLTVGSSGAQVTALQSRLITDGFLTGSVTGYYGTLTQQAVSKYQKANGLSATGSVGPSTRDLLNAGK